MTYLNWQEEIDKELDLARISRSSGNEGMARVCARRASGVAIGVYLDKNHLPDPGPSVIDGLNFIYRLPDIAPDARQAIERLTQRVNEDFELPNEIDLIDEAQKLITILLPEYQVPRE